MYFYGLRGRRLVKVNKKSILFSNLVKDIDISKYNQDEFRLIVGEIYREIFNENK
jgi:hypothetical protein